MIFLGSAKRLLTGFGFSPHLCTTAANPSPGTATCNGLAAANDLVASIGTGRG